MTAETLAPSPPAQPRPSKPNFLSALRGIWLMTWKTQLTWRRLPGAAIGLLALPILIYVTTPSPKGWAESHRLRMGSPAVALANFTRRAARAGVPLDAQQQAELTRITTEEFKRAETEWAERVTGQASAAEQAEAFDDAHERIRQRVQNVLNERQLTEFEKAQRRLRPPMPAVPGGAGWGRTTPFYHCLIDLYFFIILPLSCVRTCGALIRDELEAGTLCFLTTRPLTRARLLLIKFISQTAWLQIWLGAQTLLVLASGVFRDVPHLATLAPLLLGSQVLAVTAWSALGLFLGQISKRYMALALLYGSIVEMGIGRIPTNINSLSMMRHLQRLLGHNAELQAAFNWATADTGGPVSALVLATMIFLIGAALLFTFKEYHPTVEMQK